MIWENSIETCILSKVKQIASPGWMHETSARGWCTGMTQRDGMGKEVGGGFRMGNTCKSMADSCQCMAKPLQYCKVINLQLIKINEIKTCEHLVKIFWFSNNVILRARTALIGDNLRKRWVSRQMFYHRSPRKLNASKTINSYCE